MVRFKNRYILFQLHWKDGKIDDSLDEPALLAVFRESIRQNFGDFGLGGALVSFQGTSRAFHRPILMISILEKLFNIQIAVKYYNRWTNMCLIRCSRDQYRQVVYFQFALVVNFKDSL